MGDTQADLQSWLRAAGLARADERPAVTPLSGGVSSDVFRVDLESGPICVKRALARLKVAADWQAPVERSANEAAWLRVARRLDGPLVPEVLAEDAQAHLFAMSWFEPEEFPNWKTELAAGRVDTGFAAAVGGALGRLHAATADRPELAAQFETTELFVDLRIAPYLLHTAAAHAALAPRIEAIAAGVLATRRVLVHGDVSPKNILVSARPVFLDAECAWYGDPAFDIAFCANHLLLKAVWKPEGAHAYAGAFEALTVGYLAEVGWEEPAALEARAAPLLAALFLARVSGKSPVEYLTQEREKALVRSVAEDLLRRDALTFAEVAEAVAERLRRP